VTGSRDRVKRKGTVVKLFGQPPELSTAGTGCNGPVGPVWAVGIADAEAGAGARRDRNRRRWRSQLFQYRGALLLGCRVVLAEGAREGGWRRQQRGGCGRLDELPLCGGTRRRGGLRTRGTASCRGQEAWDHAANARSARGRDLRGAWRFRARRRRRPRALCARPRYRPCRIDTWRCTAAGLLLNDR